MLIKQPTYIQNQSRLDWVPKEEILQLLQQGLLAVVQQQQ